MTELQAKELLARRLKSQWETLAGTVPFILDNEAFPSEDAFVLMTWQELSSQQITMGPHPKIQRSGLVWVKAWTPANAGTKLASQLIGYARTIFERAVLSLGDGTEPMNVFAGMSGGGVEDGRFYMEAVRFPATYYEQQ